MDTELANGTKIKAAAKETVVKRAGSSCPTPRNSLHVLTLQMNLMSCQRLVENGIITNISNNCSILIDGNKKNKIGLVQKRYSDDLYVVHVQPPKKRGCGKVYSAVKDHGSEEKRYENRTFV